MYTGTYAIFIPRTHRPKQKPPHSNDVRRSIMSLYAYRLTYSYILLRVSDVIDLVVEIRPIINRHYRLYYHIRSPFYIRVFILVLSLLL